MKKLTLLALIFFCTFTATFARITVRRSGSTDGTHYDRVSEDHSGKNHTLICSGPGATSCGWTVSPILHSAKGAFTAAEIERWVFETQISNGFLKGKAYFGDILVAWEHEQTTASTEISMYDYDENPTSR